MIATDEQRGRYMKYVEEAGLEKKDFWRLAAGWKQIKRLSETEIGIILKYNMIDEYFRAVLHGAPLPYNISRVPAQPTENLERLQEAGGLSDTVLTVQGQRRRAGRFVLELLSSRDERA